MNKKTALITGASTGIGRATVILLNEKGYTVYAGARRTERMKDLEQMGIHTFALDVTNEDSMATGVAAILKKEKSVDILINNAGYGSFEHFLYGLENQLQNINRKYKAGGCFIRKKSLNFFLFSNKRQNRCKISNR